MSLANGLEVTGTFTQQKDPIPGNNYTVTFGTAFDDDVTWFGPFDGERPGGFGTVTTGEGDRITGVFGRDVPVDLDRQYIVEFADGRRWEGRIKVFGRGKRYWDNLEPVGPGVMTEPSYGESVSLARQKYCIVPIPTFH